jgi:hypothetical protein
MRGMERCLGILNLPRGGHTKIKAWSSRLWVGYESDIIILGKVIMPRSPNKKGKPSPNVKGCSARDEKEEKSIQFQFLFGLDNFKRPYFVKM